MRPNEPSTTNTGSVGGQPSEDPAGRRVLEARDRIILDRARHGVPAFTPLSERAERREQERIAETRANMRRREAELDVDPEPAADEQPPLVKGVTPGSLGALVATFIFAVVVIAFVWLCAVLGG